MTSSRAAFCCRLALAGLALTIAAAPATRLAAHDRDKRRDHDQALAALVRGEILPLDKVLAAVKSTVQGEIIGVKLERKQGLWLYELKIIRADGVAVELTVDARTSTILPQRPKD